MTDVLRFARSQPYSASSNVHGQDAAAWAFLLPRLDVGRIVIVGGGEREIARALRALPVAAEPAPSIEPGAESADIVFVTASVVRRLERSPDDVAALRRCLARGGIVVLDSAREAARVARSLAPDSPTLLVAGSAHAVPSPPASYERATWVVPAPTGARRRRLARLLRRLARRRAAPGARLLTIRAAGTADAGPWSARGVFVLRADAHTPGTLPGYVSEAARHGGHVPADEGWVLEPSRGYRSQKIVFHLPKAGEIVKVTQAPAFNGRLLNEHRALVELDGRVPESLAPRPLFVGEHAGLLLVGESRLRGRPFRQASTGLPTCDVAGGVVEALMQLSRLAGSTCPGGEAAAALRDLLVQHERLNAASAAAVSLLDTALARIAEVREFPLAFTHGDPTTLNVLVDEDGAIGLIDWENAEPWGMPLWDVLHFVYAYGQWGAERRGSRWTADVVAQMLLADSAFASFRQRSVERYVEGTGLAPELVEPLTLTFWMGLAIREATRRRTSRSAAPYARLLERAARGQVRV